MRNENRISFLYYLKWLQVSAQIPLSCCRIMETLCLSEGDRMRIRERDGKDFDVLAFDLDSDGSAAPDDAGLRPDHVGDDVAGV